METLANSIALACIAHFVWSYYWTCYRKGYSIDIWHFILFFNVFAIHVMLPFNRSDLNVLALGPELLVRAQDHLTEAYLISAVSYLCLVAGGSLWRVRLGIGVRGLFSRLIEFPTRGSLLLLSSRSLLVVHGWLAITMMAAVLFYFFNASGFNFNLRNFLLTNTTLRPIAQFSSFYAVLIGSYCLARFYEYKERSMALILVVLVTGLLFFGERSAIAGIAQMTVLVFLLKKGRRIGPIVLAGGTFIIFGLAFLLGALRQATLSFTSLATDFVLSTFFGNSFSDTRDFAVVLSFWDGQFLLGKTYLAGILAFVPRFLSSFRDTWALGVVTASMAGFSPEEHPGLRIGIAGEAYLNFGLIGACLLSLFVGAGYRLIDLRMKQSIRQGSQTKMRVYSYWIIIIMMLACQNTSIASTFYTILLVLFLSWIMMKVFVLLGVPIK